jgi:hypothetical protein
MGKTRAHLTASNDADPDRILRTFARLQFAY